MSIPNARGLGLRQQALLAAVRLTGGDIKKTFSAEDLLVEAWQFDNAAWGLRGHEDKHPDVEKINKELNRRGSIGLVGQGVFERVGTMLYRLTPNGLHEAANLQPTDEVTRDKANRELEVNVREVLEHPAFRAWLNDPSKPKYFRDAGHFWGIAPGTPPDTVRKRISHIDRVLAAASELLVEKGVEVISERRGKLLFDKQDIERGIGFQRMLKQRFARELLLLDPEFTVESPSPSAQPPTIPINVG